MDYLEIEGKAQLERYGIRTNGGVILEGDEIPPEVTFPCVLKGTDSGRTPWTARSCKGC